MYCWGKEESWGVGMEGERGGEWEVSCGEKVWGIGKEILVWIGD